jgi:hypothetical protein
MFMSHADLIRGVTFGVTDLIRGVTFGATDLIRGVTFGATDLIREGTTVNLACDLNIGIH